jgi:hypothetical protein
VLILHGTLDKGTKPSGSQLFYETAGSADKTLKLYEGHYHDLLHDVDKEQVLADITTFNWRVNAQPRITSKRSRLTTAETISEPDTPESTPVQAKYDQRIGLRARMIAGASGLLFASRLSAGAFFCSRIDTMTLRRPISAVSAAAQSADEP